MEYVNYKGWNIWIAATSSSGVKAKSIVPFFITSSYSIFVLIYIMSAFVACDMHSIK